MKIIFASHNQSKVKELKLMFGGTVEILSAEEVGIHDDVIEDGKTFKENSLKKAKFVNRKTKQWTMADDSGICIDYLGGEPGIYSARWAGELSEVEMIDKLLERMNNAENGKRKCYFYSVAVLVSPEGKEWFFEGRVDGEVTRERRGKQIPKFPYDVVFLPDGYDKTFAEMTKKQKNSLSHRGISFRKLEDFVKNLNK